MSYYTERHGLRKPVERTYVITYEMYAMLFDCCEKYFENLGCKYPEECPDGNGCCGLDYEKFNTELTFDIPTIFKDSRGCVGKPQNLAENYGYNVHMVVWQTAILFLDMA